MDRLRGAGIVVTRPAERGQSLCRRIAAEGGRALSFPALEIEPLEEPLITLSEGPVDWLVFTSVNAVNQGLAHLGPWRGPRTRIAAIGDATATALVDAGWDVDIVPEGAQDSEALLASDDFENVRGQRVLLVKGEGGRELLREELDRRGATTGTANVYRRRQPETDIQPLLDWWQQDGIDAIVVSSRAGLENLCSMLDTTGRGFLARTTVVAPTARMIKLIRDLGIRAEPVIARGASDEAVMAALLEWWRSDRDRRQQDPE